MLLLSEITYENREANQSRLRLRVTLLIPAGPGVFVYCSGVFIAQGCLWLRHPGLTAEPWGCALGFAAWGGGGAKLWGPPKPPTLSPVPGKSQEKQAGPCAAHWLQSGAQRHFSLAALKPVSPEIMTHFVIFYIFFSSGQSSQTPLLFVNCP